MLWNQIGLFANVVLTIAYLAIARSILLPLARTGQLWRNHLGFATGLIFFTCGIGHVIHAEHTIRMVLAHGWANGDIDWHLGLWDSLTAMCAIAYWRQRQIAGPPVDTAALFEDLQRRQKELEAQALEAHLREELAVERELAARQSFALAFDSAPNGMAFVDRDGGLVRVNGAFADIVGRTVDELTGVCLEDLLLGPEGPLAPGSLTPGNPIEVRLERTDGPTTWARLVVTTLTDASTLLVQLEDVTERRRAQARLNHLALHDPLTRLPNRLLFHDRTRAALLQSSRSKAWTGCLYIDLDHFKVVNDSLGHAAGDEVLRTISGRLLAQLRPGDTVARMGGDEFCVLLQELADPAEASVIAERIIEALDGYVEIDGMLVTTGASIGVAVAQSGDGVTSETLVRDADTALYRAKGSGRGHQVAFDEAIRDDAERRLRVEAELRRGIGDDEITVAYQPQWSISQGRVVGVEALVRWQHPTLGERQPAEFVAIAVETGLIVELGREVLSQALEAFAGWSRVDPHLVLSVNLSSRQLGRPHFVDDVPCAPRRLRRARHLPVPRAHRDGPDRDGPVRPHDARRPSAARDPAGRRRRGDRAVVAHPPRHPPGRRHQDRPHVRRAGPRARRQPGCRRRPPVAGPHDRRRRRGRGCRDPGAARGPRRPRLRRHPGLRREPPGDGRRDLRPARQRRHRSPTHRLTRWRFR